VRNSAGDVVQFLYGEDGMDGVRVEGQNYEHLKDPKSKLETKFSYNTVLSGAGTEDWLLPQQVRREACIDGWRYL
jgi:DNA-directed RNA polymerase II subunit RPB1